jgi:hypothetical protein
MLVQRCKEQEPLDRKSTTYSMTSSAVVLKRADNAPVREKRITGKQRGGGIEVWPDEEDDEEEIQ